MKSMAIVGTGFALLAGATSAVMLMPSAVGAHASRAAAQPALVGTSGRLVLQAAVAPVANRPLFHSLVATRNVQTRVSFSRTDRYAAGTLTDARSGESTSTTSSGVGGGSVTHTYGSRNGTTAGHSCPHMSTSTGSSTGK